MRDNRRARLILALLLLTAFTLITLDYRSGAGGPLRDAGNAVFGPVERAVSAVTSPIGRFFSSLGHLSGYRSENEKLRARVQQLQQQLRLTDADRAELEQLRKLLDLAGRGQFRIVPARVIGWGGALGFESTATIDVGSRDGVHKNMTVIDGDGLVGKTLDVGPTTATILLGNDPNFTAGARLARNNAIGHVDGGGRGPMTFTLLGNQDLMRVGDQLVTFASVGERPFVPEVPIGRITRVVPTPGQLYRTAIVKPYADFTSVGVVSVVISKTRTVKRNSLLPPSPTPSPSSPSPSSRLEPGVTPSRSGSPSESPT
jgi:rod shape-determining protein MreC